MRPRLALALALASAGCHVTVLTELTHTRATRAEPHRDRARARPPAITLADGALRFVGPLVCPSDDLVEVEPEPGRTRGQPGDVRRRRDRHGGRRDRRDLGAEQQRSGGDPLTYGGLGAAAIGLPFAIGPWIGNGVDSSPGVPRTERRPGAEIACGSRPVGGGFARLTIGDRAIYGAVDADGVFATSPFTWIDAFDAAGGPAFAVHAELGGRVIDKVFDAGALAPWRETFLASTRLDVSVQPLRAVPRITAGAIRIGHVLVGSQATLHVVVPLANAGPGDAWQVRATIAAASPELDGRILYIGHIAPKATAIGELWVALSPEADDAIRRGTIELAFHLADARPDHAGGVDPLPRTGRRRRVPVKVAIVGSGIAGLGAARALAGRAGIDVEVFEAADRPGGHAYTVDVDGPDGPVAVDMGFIVCNRENYPRFMALCAELGVETRPTSMAFSVALPERDLEWSSAGLNAVFADRRRLVDPRHWRFLAAVLRLLRDGRRDLGARARPPRVARRVRRRPPRPRRRRRRVHRAARRRAVVARARPLRRVPRRDLPPLPRSARDAAAGAARWPGARWSAAAAATSTRWSRRCPRRSTSPAA